VEAVREEEVKLIGVRFVKEVGLSREWQKEGVVDVQSGESEEVEVTGEGIGESEMEERVPATDIWREVVLLAMLHCLYLYGVVKMWNRRKTCLKLTHYTVCQML